MEGTQEKIEGFFTLRNEIEELDRKLSDKKKVLEQMGEALIEDMETSGLSQLKDTKGRTIYLKAPSVYASMVKARKKEALDVVSSWGLGDMIQNTISAPALSRVIKERLENGDDVPDCFSYYLKKKLGHRR